MILITGATGQLGRALVAEATVRQRDFMTVSRPDFDLARPDTIDACFAQARPELVINAAAYTAVDAAETEPEAAQAGNHTGPERLARLCAAHSVPLIHMSTDYVFDGTKGAPYVETDPTNPTGVYGLTKRDGETAVLATGAQAIILRTAWLYAPYGKNFLRTMLNAAQRTPVLRVVADQRGTPTAAPDLAAVILTMAAKIRAEGWRDEFAGIFHATNAGATTWHGFACAIFEEAQQFGHPLPRIDPITTADWHTPAKRPADSRLDGAKLRRVFGCSLAPWRESLKAVCATLAPGHETVRRAVSAP
jgi:dTDP-4-dehydrorhamnose reductase